MSARHTPGPWEIDVRNGITARINGGNRLVANVIPSPALYQLAHFDRLLIAAAPDLLEALRVAYGDLQRCPGHTIDMLGRIEAAIAKATGGAA